MYMTMIEFWVILAGLGGGGTGIGAHFFDDDDDI